MERLLTVFITSAGRVRRSILTAALIGSLVLLCVPPNRIGTSTTPVDAENAEGDRAGADAPELVAGKTIRGQISRGARNTYTVSLAAGQRLHLLINKGDLQISAALYAPGGQRCAEYTGLLYGPLEVSHLAEASGTYVLELSMLETDAGERGYELQVSALRVAGARDIDEDRAVNASAEAERLRALWQEQPLRQSVARYVEAAARWHSAGHRRRAAAALENAADVSFILSDYRQARDFYQRVLTESQSIGDRRGEAVALSQIGRVHGYLRDEQVALRHAEKALSYYRQARAGDSDLNLQRAEAQALNNLGEAHYSLGDLKKALESFDRSLAIFIAAGDRRGEAQARLNSGYAYSDSGALDKALAHYQQALALWRAVGDRRGEALSLNAIGGVHAFLGERQRALELNRQAVALFRAVGDRQGEAVALNGVARVYEELNEPSVALDNYTHALRLYERNGARGFASVTEYSIARVYHSLGKTGEALAHYERCLALSRLVRKRRVEAYVLIDIAELHNSLRREGPAFGQYAEALKLFEQIGDRQGQAKVLGNIGGIHAAAGRGREALNFYRRALALTRMADDRDAEAATLYEIANTERRLGDLPAALSHVESAITLVESMRVQVASPSLRSSYFASVHKHYGLYISLLMELHRARPEEGFDARALQASESARARSLVETLPEARTAAEQGAPPELLARADDLARRLGAIAQSGTRAPGGERHARDAAAAGQDIRRLATEYTEVQAQIREQTPAHANPPRPRPLSLQDIQSELEGDTLLLEYALGEEKSYLWAVTANSLESFELPSRAAVEGAARRLYELLVARQPADGETPADYHARVKAADDEYERLAAELSRTLLGPVGTQLGTRRLLIVADGQLQYIPFEALPSPPTAPTGGATAVADSHEPSHFPPLVLRNEVVSLPSVSTLAALRRESRGRARAPKLVAVFADPVFERDDPRLPPSGQQAERVVAASSAAPQLGEALRSLGRGGGAASGLSRLPATLQEARAIMNVAPGGAAMIATGFDACRTTASGAELGQYRILHFATHGIINDEHPELSGIVLSLLNERGEEENGFLQLHDIYGLRLSADLVVLSACNTGLGKDVRGEGLVGITRGFMYAGSRSVVASLWKVDDAATSALMTHFYRAMLRDGLPPAAALRAAKEAMWRQGQWRAPFYWASFVLQGEYRDDIKAGHNRAAVVALPLVFALLAGGVFALWRRRAGRRVG